MEKMRLGWREWVGLPGLELPAIKAKIDTGARTSALHALDPEPFLEKGAPHVRFLLLPIQGMLLMGRVVTAPLVDRRRVTNSGGFGQERFVIHLDLRVGKLTLPVEVTLADRKDMRFRMLLGRKALEGFVVDPAESYLLGKSVEQKRFLNDVRAELKRAPSLG